MKFQHQITTIVFILALAATSIIDGVRSDARVLGASSEQLPKNQYAPRLELQTIEFGVDQKIRLLSSSEIRLYNHRSDFVLKLETQISPQSFVYEVENITLDESPRAIRIEFVDKYGVLVGQYFFVNPDDYIIIPAKLSKCADEISDPQTQLIDPQNCVSQEAVNNLTLQNTHYDEREILLNPETLTQLNQMKIAAESDGIDFGINSGFRNIEDQTAMQEFMIAAYGEQKGQELSAPPGYSEHHLGTAVDLNSKEYDGTQQIGFAHTDAFLWMQRNAWKYGFVMSYPEGFQDVTGYPFEPWHWRYVGVEHAENIHKLEDITLREYLVLINSIKL